MKAKSIFIELFSLMAIAFAQPVLDIFSKNAAFFVAWHISGFEIFLVVLCIYIVLPLILSSVVVLAYKINFYFGLFFRCAALIVLVSVFCMQIFKQLGMQGFVLITATSITTGSIFALVYLKSNQAKKFVVYLSPVTIIFPMLFVIALHSQKFFYSADTGLAQRDELPRKSDTPVVLVILDELPVITLLNKSGSLDRQRFPNISSFADQGVWYFNTTSASTGTTVSVPSILSGKLKGDNVAPNYNNYPNNLFSLLSHSHHLRVIESVTSLCPKNLCQEDSFPLKNKIYGITYDIGLVYLHLIVPDEMASKLPSVNYKLNDFAGFSQERGGNGDLDWDGRDDKHRRFIQGINDRDDQMPSFFYYHNLFPHYPWYYLPSGKKYLAPDGIPGLLKEKWTSDEWPVIQGYQRHILQTMYVDKMFGEAIETLKKQDIFDKSLIILTADHGVSFEPGAYRRITDEQYRSMSPASSLVDQLRVPLFIKYPNSSHIGISNRKVSTLDILPTVADVLDIEIEFEVDGESMLTHANEVSSAFPENNDLMNNLSLKRKIELFGEGDVNLIYTVGDHNNLIGTNTFKNKKTSSLEGKVSVNNIELLRMVDKSAPLIPTRIIGKVATDNDSQFSTDFAIAVNDVICSVTKTYSDKGNLLFNSLLSEKCLLPGENTIKVFEITGDGKEISLAYIDQGKGSVFGVYEGNTIKLKSGETFTQSKMNGKIDRFNYDKETGLLNMAGWSVDGTTGKPAKYILYRIGKDIFFGASVSGDRPDIAEHFQDTFAGFEFFVPVRDLSSRELDIITVSKDGKFDVLSTAHFAEKMSEKELKMFGLYEQRNVFGVYRGNAITLNGGQVLNRSAIDGKVEVFSYNENSRLVRVAGWAADLRKGRPVKQVLYRIGETVYSISSGMLLRPDVARTFNNPGLAYSGFEFYVPVKDLSGREFDIIAVSEDKGFSELSTATFAEKMSEQELEMFGLVERYEYEEFGTYRNASIILSKDAGIFGKAKLAGSIDIFSYDEKTDLLQVAGWAADLENGRPVKYLLFRVDDVVYMASSYLSPRQDIAKAFNNSEMTDSGFKFHVPVARISGHRFEIIAASEEGWFDVLSTAKFTEKMSEEELRKFGFSQLPDKGFKHLLSGIFGAADTEDKPESIGTYGTKEIVLENGEALRKSEAPLQGHIDVFSHNKETDLVNIAGWSANVEKGEPAKYVLFRIDDEVFYGSPVSLKRSDVATAFKQPSLSITGFQFSVPYTLVSAKSFIEIISVMQNGEYESIPVDKSLSASLGLNK